MLQVDPTMKTKEIYGETFKLKLDTRLFRRLDKQAKVERKSMASVMREACEIYLRQSQQSQPSLQLSLIHI